MINALDMEEMNLIANRLRELSEEDSRLAAEERRIREQRDANRVEREELEQAGRVVARLSGAKWPSTGAGDAATAEATSSAKPKDIPKMPDMITQTLRESILDELEPKEITAQIANRWWPDVKVNAVASTAWRMWKSGRLEKDEGSSSYRLPRKEEAPDDDPGGKPSEASETQPSPEDREGVFG